MTDKREKPRCEGVRVGGKVCRRTYGVMQCGCGCDLTLCSMCMMGDSGEPSHRAVDAAGYVAASPEPQG